VKEESSTERGGREEKEKEIGVQTKGMVNSNQENRNGE